MCDLASTAYVLDPRRLATSSSRPPPPMPDAPRIHPAALVSVNAILVMVSIAALIGIWFG